VRPSSEFVAESNSFWAHVRIVSEELGYSSQSRGGKIRALRRYAVEEIEASLQNLGVSTERILSNGSVTDFGKKLVGYLNFRAEVLEREVLPMLMDREQARAEFERLRRQLNPTCPLPMNKQKGEKRHEAFLTGIVNMLTELALAGEPFNGEPRRMTLVTRGQVPLRTLSRRMDGAYPDVVDPHAVWEVKEYYGTTSFGSRVADGVYETMLDGFELAELYEHEGRKVLHYLIVDDRYTWWDCGRSYLCRIVDMMHMGLVDEALFGREVLTRWPEIVRSWA
jgi:hypothetical protein